MSDRTFQPFYADGERVLVGDRVVYAQENERTITGVFDPDHEVSRFYNMPNGCAEVTPAAIHSLPLDEDFVLVARASENRR